MTKSIAVFFSIFIFLTFFFNNTFAGSINTAGNISTQMQTYSSPDINSTVQTYKKTPAISQNWKTNYTGANNVVNVTPNSTDISNGKNAAYSNKPFGNNLKNPSYLNSHFSKPLNTNADLTTVGVSYYCGSHPTNIYTSLADCKTDCSGNVCYVLKKNTHLVCQSSTQFLNIFAEPSSTGDFTAIIRADPKMTGSFTTSITTPLVSGVCTNGFISCEPGTWHNCKYYEWGIKHKDSAGHVYNSLRDCRSSSKTKTCSLTSDKMIHYYQTTTMTPLGNCFAVNNSASPELFYNDFDNIMTTFGSGIVGHLSSEENLAVTNAKLNPNSSSLGYYGANPSSCSTAPNSSSNSGGKSVTALKQDYGEGEIGGADAAAFTASKNPNSNYSMLVNSQYMKKHPVNSYTCKISRTVIFSHGRIDTETTQPCTIAPQCNNLPVAGQILKCIYFPSEIYPYTVGGQYTTRNDCGSQCIGGTCTGGGQRFTTKPVCSTYIGTYQEYAGGCHKKHGKDQANYINHYIYKQNTNYVIYATASIATNSSCHPAANCKLSKEQVCDYNGQNCVTTFDSNSPTTVSTLPTCTSMSDSLTGGTWTVCDNGSVINYSGTSVGILATGTDIYWNVKKTYTCPASTIPPPDVSRARNVTSGINYAGGNINYTDTLTGHTSNGIKLNLSGFKKSSCIPACIVIDANKKDSVVPNSGMPVNGTQTTKKQYVTCERKNPTASWTCPVPTGYKEKAACACINGGARAVSALVSSDSAAHDMICSKE